MRTGLQAGLLSIITFYFTVTDQWKSISTGIMMPGCSCDNFHVLRVEMLRAGRSRENPPVSREETTIELMGYGFFTGISNDSWRVSRNVRISKGAYLKRR